MFKPYQSVDWYHTEAYKNTPLTTTQEMLQINRASMQQFNGVRKKQCSLQSLNFEVSKMDTTKEIPLTTSYKRDFAAPYDFVCSSKPFQETTPSHFWNRKPLNDFALERITSSEFMFMDDHLVNVTPERLRINFFRQLRNQHYPLV